MPTPNAGYERSAPTVSTGLSSSAAASSSTSSASTAATIAVGTALAGGPPRRSQRALLTHWAPDLGASVESLVGPGMGDVDGREPSVRVAAHPLPVEAVSLAAAAERPVPESHDLATEGLHLVDVAGHGVVGEMSSHDAREPASLCFEGPMASSHQQGSDLAQLRRHSLRDRLSQQQEAPVLGRRAVVREAQELERLRPAEAPLLALLGGEPPEADQARLLGIQPQPKLGQALRQVSPEPLRVRAMLKPQHDVVGVPDDEHVTAGMLPAPLLGPQIEEVVQVDVCEQR